MGKYVEVKMTVKCHCEDTSKITNSLEIRDMIDSYLIELDINGNTWDTLYKCKSCGAYWEERYTGGRWDGWPELYKVTADYVNEKWE